MPSLSLTVRRIPVMFLLVLAIAACGAAPEQTGALTPTPLLSPPAPASTVVPPTVPATPTPPPNTPTSQPTTAPATSTPPQSTPTSLALLDNAALAQYLYQQVKDGTPVVEIADPNIPLPDDIHPGQIEKYFQIGTISIGLVLQRSMNIVPDLPIEYDISFNGVIVSQAGAPWRKYLQIRDVEYSDKNNPYYLWAQEGQLYLSIVDQGGGGSGEGIMKPARLSAAGDWEIVGCHYFVHNNPDTDGDYFAFSQYLDKHKPHSSESCHNVDIVVLP